MRHSRALLTALFSLSLASPALAERYEIDPNHSDVSFKVRHMVVSKVQGRFDKFTGAFEYDEKTPEKWSAEARIDAASVNTANADRDNHLRQADFLDTANHPAMEFKSAGVTDVTGGGAKLQGNLSIRGVERPVALDLVFGGTVTDPRGAKRAGFGAAPTLNPPAFGVRF